MDISELVHLERLGEKTQQSLCFDTSDYLFDTRKTARKPK
jgi:hypothetical protein